MSSIPYLALSDKVKEKLIQYLKGLGIFDKLKNIYKQLENNSKVDSNKYSILRQLCSDGSPDPGDDPNKNTKIITDFEEAKEQFINQLNHFKSSFKDIFDILKNKNNDNNKKNK